MIDLAKIYSHPDSAALVKAEPPTDAKPVDETERTQTGEPASSLAEKLYANQGEPPGSYERVFGLTFDSLAQQARESKDAELSKSVNEARTATTSFLTEYQVSEVTARDLINTVEHYRQQPVADDEAFEKAGARATEVLKSEWGSSYEKTLAGVQRVATEACERMPWLDDLLLAGVANDLRWIRACAVLARRRGYL